MKCPKCNTRLYCQESRQHDNYTRMREYACISCNQVFYSIEQMDRLPGHREAQGRMKRIYKESRDVKGIHS